MNKELNNLIIKFNMTQERAVEILENEFECPRPESTMDFITRCVPNIRIKNYTGGNYKIRPHGYGMEIDIEGTIIDFDFGKHGEFNGFDSWRLYHFVKSNKINTTLNTEDKIKTVIDSALSEGYITISHGLNYVTNRQ